MTSTADIPMRDSSSPELSDPPSVLSDNSPTNFGNSRNRPGELDEIVVNQRDYRYDGSGQPVLTKDGLPRRKPGPKPGTKLKRLSNTDGSPADGAKVRRPRKSKDPTAPPNARKRKLASAEPEAKIIEPQPEHRAATIGASSTPVSARQTQLSEMGITNLNNRVEPMAQPSSNFKREVSSAQPRISSMSSLLNDPEPPPRPSAPPARSSGTNYDPIRSNYDPVRETMVTHSFSSSMGSPRAPASNTVNRASASPSIASLVDPTPTQNLISPVPSRATFSQSTSSQPPRAKQETSSVPVSPNPFRQPVSPNPFRQEFVAPPAPKSAAPEMRKSIPEVKKSALEIKKSTPTVVLPSKAGIEIRPTSITTIGAGYKRTPPKNQSAASSSPQMGAQKDPSFAMGGGAERSILDFGKAEPGQELTTPSISLHIPLGAKPTTEQRARKARIAAASAALAQNDSSREGDEMSVDESENEDSNVDMGGISGPDKPGEIKKRKKRHFKEDEYDKDDDFVDDSEMLWEEQAAASRDGFFVYSGPLIPEVEKPEPGRGDGLPKRGRGSRGGRGSARAAGTTRGRGGGPGSRGGAVRKPRMTKADKAQLDREKLEREQAFLQKSGTGTNYNVLHPTSPQFAGL
ncbi:Histone promoter control protein 2 [Apiospora hydei]|uniref:Histone promoter control protein 2 n=1 Tax=Apiospora hydei TaxID=1337664 RepID=A0ABR1V5I7_9PEZI